MVSGSSSVSTRDPRYADVRHLVQGPTENTRLSSNPAQNFINGQQIQSSPKEILISQDDTTVAAHLRLADDTQHHEEQFPNQTNLNTLSRRPDLPPRASSSSLASSIQTVIHLSPSTAIDPTSSCRTARGSFVESGSGSSQLLSELTAKSSNEHSPSLNSEALEDFDLHANSKSSKIQFHDVVRIAGGISSKPKRKRASKQPPRSISTDRRSSFMTEQRHPSSSSCSPLRYSGFVEGLPNYPKRQISNPDYSDNIITVGHRQANRLEIRNSSSSPIGRSFSHNRQYNLKPGPPSARSSFSYQSRSDSLSRPPFNNLNTPSASHPTGSPLSLTHTLSISSSLTPSHNHSATITSRSSSPASSLYLPLRIPVVRAPAPFFGPTAERVAKVRERRQVAQRDAERAKGGWKAWWNNWYHQSDKFAARKGKTKQDPAAITHDHQPFHSNPIDESDSDDGSCYHDIILEHERKKLERKLKKLQKISGNIHHPKSQSCKHHHKRVKLNSEKTASKNQQSWLSWISSFTIGLPPPPAHPLKLPTPGTGILRPQTFTASPILPGRPVSPLVCDQPCMFSSGPTLEGLTTVQEVNSRTPLLAQSQIISKYGNNPSIVPDLVSSNNEFSFKSPAETRFGSAPKRWFTLVWWRWKIPLIFHLFWVKICNKFDDIFHIDWDTSRRYEGWENV